MEGTSPALRRVKRGIERLFNQEHAYLHGRLNADAARDYAFARNRVKRVKTRSHRGST
jgi:hypothetical protein